MTWKCSRDKKIDTKFWLGNGIIVKLIWGIGYDTVVWIELAQIGPDLSFFVVGMNLHVS
jgi:hypothetical protein